MISTKDPCRIPESCYLQADTLGKYITPKLFSEFHPKEDRDSFAEWMKTAHVLVSIDPLGDFAYSVETYEDWLHTEGRL